MHKIKSSLLAIGAAAALAIGFSLPAQAATQAIYTGCTISGTFCYLTAPHPTAGNVTFKINATGSGTESLTAIARNKDGGEVCRTTYRPVDAAKSFVCRMPAGNITLQAINYQSPQLTIQY